MMNNRTLQLMVGALDSMKGDLENLTLEEFKHEAMALVEMIKSEQVFLVKEQNIMQTDLRFVVDNPEQFTELELPY